MPASVTIEHGSGAGHDPASAAHEQPVPPAPELNLSDIDDMEVEDLKKMLKDLLKENDKNDSDSYKKTEIVSVKGCDTRNAKRPTEWTGCVDEYKVWHVLFNAYLKTFDPQWKTILQRILAHGSGMVEDKLIGDSKIENFMKLNGIGLDLREDLQEMLYISLLQYTGGDIRTRVHATGETEAFQAYRWVHYKGTDIDEKKKIELRGQVLNPEPADSVGDVEAKVAKWKSDIARLTSADPMAITLKDRVQPYWSLLPEVIQDHLLNRNFSPTDWESYDKLEVAVEGFMRRWDLKNSNARKNQEKGRNINAISNPDPTEQPIGALDWQWCDYYGKYVAIKPLNVAVKRRRTEEGEDEQNAEERASAEQPQNNATPNGQKGGKGKGKRGPRDGCWECSGDHYANECPHLRFSRNQWKDLKPPLYPNVAWNRLFDPIQQSWKGKGKGKADGGNKGKRQGKRCQRRRRILQR